MRLILPLAALIAPALLLAACNKAEEENIEVQSDKLSKALEERHNQLSAEAANDADAAAAPFDNEADALLNRMAGVNEAAPAAAANAAAPAAKPRSSR
jgi:hypothetical protein